MRLTKEQLARYQEAGFLLVENVFSSAEIDLIKTQLPSLYAEDTPRRVYEKGSSLIRSIFAPHYSSEVFRRLLRHPAIIEPAMQIVGSQVYAYQFKINAKAGFGGDIWEWHQDYIVWHREDGVPLPRIVNLAIFLEDVNEFNGPIFFLPGSQSHGIIEAPDRQEAHTVEEASDKGEEKPWMQNLTSYLRFALTKEVISGLISQHGIVSSKGPAGSVLFFHCNIVHASPGNLSPFDRPLVFASYNSIENIPIPVSNPRPDFIVGRDYEPIIPIAREALLQPVEQCG